MPGQEQVTADSNDEAKPGNLTIPRKRRQSSFPNYTRPSFLFSSPLLLRLLPSYFTFTFTSLFSLSLLLYLSSSCPKPITVHHVIWHVTATTLVAADLLAQSRSQRKKKKSLPYLSHSFLPFFLSYFLIFSILFLKRRTVSFYSFVSSVPPPGLWYWSLSVLPSTKLKDCTYCTSSRVLAVRQYSQIHSSNRRQAVQQLLFLQLLHTERKEESKTKSWVDSAEWLALGDR